MRTFSVTVRRGGGTNQWGDAQSPSSHQIAGCTRWPRTSTETDDRANTVTSGWMLSVPVGADLLATDEVQLPGDPTWWQVIGDLLPYESPLSDWRPGVPVALTRTEG